MFCNKELLLLECTIFQKMSIFKIYFWLLEFFFSLRHIKVISFPKKKKEFISLILPVFIHTIVGSKRYVK